jgi:TolB-like protein
MTDKPSRIRAFTGELKRRHVFQVGFAYLAIAYVTLEGASFILPALHVPDWVMTVLVVLGLIGFPVALALGWIFDLSPEGVVRTEPVHGLRTHGRVERRAVAEVHPRKSIAVLPFANVSGDRDNEYFSDGITEEIIATLSKISDLHVASRTTAMACKGTSMTVRELGQQLRVGTVVEGSVRKAGDKVRIVGRLVDAGSDERLWSDTYDRELKDIFEIQTDVARRIATALHAELTAIEERSIAERPTEDLVAYDLYLRARHAWNQRTEDGIERSRSRGGRDGSFHSRINEALVMSPRNRRWVPSVLASR